MSIPQFTSLAVIVGWSTYSLVSGKIKGSSQRVHKIQESIQTGTEEARETRARGWNGVRKRHLSKI